MKKNKFITMGVCAAVLANIVATPAIALAETVTEQTADTTETVEKAPVGEAPVEKEPVVEEPVIEKPVIETPVAETPVIETPVIEAPVTETPAIEAPIKDTPVAETPTAPSDPNKVIPQVPGESNGLNSATLSVPPEKYIRKGAKYNPLSGVQAYIGNKDISSTVKIVSNNVNVNKPTPPNTTPYVIKYSVSVTTATGEVKTTTASTDVYVLDDKYGMITASIANFTIAQNGDIDGEIAKRIVVKGPDGKILPASEYTLNNVGTAGGGDTGKFTFTVLVNSKYGVAEATVTVTVIKGVELNAADQTIFVGDTFDPLKVVTAYEINADGSKTPLGAYDVLTDSGIGFSSNVDTSVASDDYKVTYTAKNSSGVTENKTITVKVVESNLNITVPSTDVKVMQGATFNPMAGVTVVDDRDGEIDGILTVSGDTVDTSVLGATYSVTYDAVYNGKAANSVTIKVTVIDRLATISAADQTVNIGDILTDAMILSWATASDPVDGDNLPVTNYKVLDGPIDTKVPGSTYTIEYSYENTAGNVATATIKLKVADLIAPILNAENQVMYVGEKLTEDMILAWAKTENTSYVSYEVIGSPIKVKKSDSTLVEAGVHEIKFTATNDVSARNTRALTAKTVEKTITLTVKNRDAKDTNDNGSKNPGKQSTQKYDKNTPIKEIKSSNKKLPQTGVEENSLMMTLSGMLMIAFYSVFRKRKNGLDL